MKVEASFSLSPDLLDALTKRASSSEERSALIEKAVWAFLNRTSSRQRAECDLEILNRNADRLNEEAEDVLAYQALW
jgi:hypothetical protein